MKIGKSSVQFRTPINPAWTQYATRRYEFLVKEYNLNLEAGIPMSNAIELATDSADAAYPMSEAPKKHIDPKDVPYWKVYATDHDPHQRYRDPSLQRIQTLYNVTYDGVISMLQDEDERRSFVAWPRKYICDAYGKLMRALDKRGIEYTTSNHGWAITYVLNDTVQYVTDVAEAKEALKEILKLK